MGYVLMGYVRNTHSQAIHFSQTMFRIDAYVLRIPYELCSYNTVFVHDRRNKSLESVTKESDELYIIINFVS